MSPFAIDGPAVISFSGGRTSGLMLRRILDAGLRDDVHVLFANTGKEREETLEFVHEVETRWQVPIHWVERRKNSDLVAVEGKKRKQRTEPDGPSFVEVTFETASRNGEPFLGVLAEREYLPNPVTRFCTTELKVRPMRDWMRARGYGDDGWTNVIGLRADEPGRVARMSLRIAEGQWDTDCPLAKAGIRLDDVKAFWRAQPFDLQLRPWEGNCDLCFLKGQAKIERIMRDRPDLAGWWRERERERERRGVRSPRAALFRADRPNYAAIFAQSQQPRLPVVDDATCSIDDLGDCLCTD